MLNAIEKKQPRYFIRADIKSFYSSIPHYKLVQDVKNTFDDVKAQAMLERVIRNPIETPNGYKNSDFGIALRGPLSQMFSAIYLKPLDDAFDDADVSYTRFQDDILILCQTKRQLNRCRRKLMNVLQERCLTLSRKKTRYGEINNGFHFLGIDYLGTRPQDNTELSQDDVVKQTAALAQILHGGGSRNIEQPQHQTGFGKTKPHVRTLRKAREQVRLMVADGFSTPKIKSYLSRWAAWWVTTSGTWTYSDILTEFIDVCWDARLRAYAQELIEQHERKLKVSEQRRLAAAV